MCWSLYMLLALLLLSSTGWQGYDAQLLDTANAPSLPKPGRYVPELYGAHRGRYMPDNSGQYQHMHRPYDGGYGDRGEPYHLAQPAQSAPRLQPIPVDDEAFALGRNDHLRFMIDFNYNGTGWQIIQFDWQRDGVEGMQYNYLTENQLWSNNVDVSQAYDYTQPTEHSGEHGVATEASYYDQAERAPAEVEQVHVEGEYVHNDQSGSNQVSYSNPQSVRAGKDPNLQAAIYEVLEYIQNHILPTLA